MAAPESQAEDARLVRAVLGGDSRAFDRLVERYYATVYAIGYARVASREAAEDLAQEAFLSAYLNLDRLARPGYFARWLSRIVRNLAIDWQRRDQKASRLVRLVPIDAFGEEIADVQTKEARAIVEADERHKALREAIMELPPAQREVVLLHYMEGLSKAEIARRTAVHSSTVGRQLDRALAAMRGALEPVLRELAPAMKAPRGVAARTTALTAAVAAMSATERAALAKAAAGAAHLASGSVAQSGGAAGLGAAFAQWKASLAAAVEGAGALGMKAKITATVAAAALAVGGAFMAAQNEQKAEGATENAKSMEFPLKVKTLGVTDQPGSIDFPYLPLTGGRNASLETQRPDTIMEEPETLSGLPFYGSLKIGKNKEVPFRLDETTGPGGGFDRLIIDLNGNGKLTDDAVFMAAEDLTSRELRRGRREYSHENVVFFPVPVWKGEKDRPWKPTIRMKANINHQAGGRASFGLLCVDSLSYLETTVELGGVKQRIWITDTNFNHRPGDMLAIGVREGDEGPVWDWREGFDTFVRDREDDGRCLSYLSLGDEYVTPLIYFGSNLYHMTVPDDLSALCLAPYQGPTGELTVPENVGALSFTWQDTKGNYRYLAMRPTNGRIRVPPGNYYLQRCTVAARHKDGDTIGARGWSKHRGPQDPVKVEANKTTSFVCGPPLVVQIEAELTTGGASRGGRRGAPLGAPQIDMNVKITGAAGESYPDWRVERFNKQGVATRIYPRFKILDEKGNEIASGELDIGQKFGAIGMGHKDRWLVPKKLMGQKIRIVPELDLGPLKTIAKPVEIQIDT